MSNPEINATFGNLTELFELSFPFVGSNEDFYV